MADAHPTQVSALSCLEADKETRPHHMGPAGGTGSAEQLPNWRDKEIRNGGGLGFQAEWPQKPGGGTWALPTEASGGLAWGSASTWQQGMGESLGKKCRKASG